MSSKTTNQPGSNDLQPGRERSRNQQANDTSGLQPNGEQTRTNANKSKQGPEDNHDTDNQTTQQLADERGGHGHSGHSGSRNGSR